MKHTEPKSYLSAIQKPDLQIIRKPQVLKMLGISKSNFHLKLNAGLLPQAIALGANSVGYFKHEVTAVLLAMAMGKNQDEIKLLVKSLVEQRQQLAA
jgi:predicted DNA-binding transcriptional regulator AlpA